MQVNLPAICFLRASGCYLVVVALYRMAIVWPAWNCGHPTFEFSVSKSRPQTNRRSNPIDPSRKQKKNNAPQGSSEAHKISWIRVHGSTKNSRFAGNGHQENGRRNGIAVRHYMEAVSPVLDGAVE